ncbi:putative alkyl hydroperoxide reductase family protein, partial [Acinetobacter baumannii 24812_10]
NEHIGQGRMTLEEIVAKLIPIQLKKTQQHSMPKMRLMYW